MIDRRESIISRIETILSGMPEFDKVLRNAQQVDDVRDNQAIVYDDNEVIDQEPTKSRSSRAPRLITMTPGIFIVLANYPSGVGPELNAVRVKVIDAILNDDTLAGLITTVGFANYEGCETGVHQGRSQIGGMRMSFAFTYPLIISELT